MHVVRDFWNGDALPVKLQTQIANDWGEVWETNCTVGIVEAGYNAYQILQKGENVPFNIEYLRYVATLALGHSQHGRDQRSNIN